MKYLITGGAGFIGSAMARLLVSKKNNFVTVIDSLTYASDKRTLSNIGDSNNFNFLEVDICDSKKVKDVMESFKPNIIIHFAAESHVDRSIDSPEKFIKTNIIGTYVLLEEARLYYQKYKNELDKFLFHHVSTDEVFGDLEDFEEPFTEITPYDPSSPYSASKASSDHLVRAWHRTFKLPITISNCSNNYGPYHFPEKLIPLSILNALNGKKINVYGDGSQIRDWLYVDDHVEAINKIIDNGKQGETYNIGGNCEKTNLEVVQTICSQLDLLIDNKPNNIDSFQNLITFVEDRPGHDKRYGIDATKILKELHWGPTETFKNGIAKTITWYIENDWWWKPILKKYQGERLGKVK